MFDRCDTDARSVIDAALDESRRRGHGWLGTEHVLLALAKQRGLLPHPVADLLPDAGTVAAALDADPGPSRQPDAELLRVVGVDVEAVRSAVRRTFGDAALEDLGRRRVHQPWQPWRRPARRCLSILAGSMSVAPRLKQALDVARQEADRRRRAAVDPAMLPLGMVEVEEAMSNRILRDVGVDPEALRRSLRSAS